MCLDIFSLWYNEWKNKVNENKSILVYFSSTIKLRKYPFPLIFSLLTTLKVINYYLLRNNVLSLSLLGNAHKH